MNSIHPAVSILAVAAAIATASNAPAQAQTAADPESERIRRVENGLLPYQVVAGRPLPTMSMTERMRTYNVPGVSIAVIDGGTLAWARGYGVTADGGAPVDTATMFQAASISKPVAAIAALRLVERGELSLDEDVNDRLRSWRVPENEYTRSEKVTLRRLLSHNAGLTVHGFRGYAAGESVPSILQVLNGEPPANSAPVRADTVPGTLWRYAGGGTTVAQLLMQDVTGRSFPDLLHDLVLEPAGMQNSTYEQPLPEHFAPRAATAHGNDGQPIAGRWHTYPEMAAAGLWTTPSDLARLALEVQRSLRGESGALLSPGMTREMLTIQAGSYGLGFGIGGAADSTTFAHGGANAGFRAQFFAFGRRGQGAVVMTNGDNGGPLATEILRSIAREYDWPAYRVTERTAIDVDPATLDELTGSYTVETPPVAGRTIRVQRDETGLRAQVPGLGLLSLRPISAERYFPLELDAEIAFERDANGVVNALVVTGLTPRPVRAGRDR